MDADGPLMEQPSAPVVDLALGWAKRCFRATHDSFHFKNQQSSLDNHQSIPRPPPHLPLRASRLCGETQDPRAATRTASRGFLAKAPSSQRPSSQRTSSQGIVPKNLPMLLSGVLYQRILVSISGLNPGPLMDADGPLMEQPSRAGSGFWSRVCKAAFPRYPRFLPLQKSTIITRQSSIHPAPRRPVSLCVLCAFAVRLKIPVPQPGPPAEGFSPSGEV
jgi:hypothetical protein